MASSERNEITRGEQSGGSSRYGKVAENGVAIVLMVAVAGLSGGLVARGAVSPWCLVVTFGALVGLLWSARDLVMARREGRRRALAEGQA